MSAKDRAQKAAAARAARFDAAAMEGLRQTLNNADGRAFLWEFYARNAEAEFEPGARGRRGVALDLMRAMRIADFEGVQIMREEWEKPKQGTQAEADDEGEGE